MFAIARNLATSDGLLSRLSGRIAKGTRTLYLFKGTWPEPITQPTLEQFLQEADYFEEPKKFVNIGLVLNRSVEKAFQPNDKQLSQTSDSLDVSDSKVDDLLELLGQEAELPPLDTNDTLVGPDQLANLALSHGIYRDLFDRYVPTTDYISFTPQQAERLDRMIPYYWITDLPHSRVQRHKPEPKPLYYFEPVISVCARFIQGSGDNLYAHTPYHGNIIPASLALSKPSITLDGGWLLSEQGSNNLVKSTNWTSGDIHCNNFPETLNSYLYSILILNLDSIHADLPNLHWFVANISPKNSDGGLKYDEICDYLPVHGIKGFGHSRYVFLVLQHELPFDRSQLRIDTFSPDSRLFDTKSFIEKHSDKNIKPAGISWFQTTWDESSNKIFHDYMKMKAPVYDALLPKYEERTSQKKTYPGKVPFNVFLDHCRTTKEINKQVLLERLKTVDPCDYRDQYVPPRLPPTVFDDGNMPSWLRIVQLKKSNKIGYWRGLRPASATIPLNNNADLDHPIRPLAPPKKRPPGYHNLYPARPVKKLIRDLPYSKPASEHQSTFIQDGHEMYESQAREVAKECSEIDDAKKNSGK